MGYVQRIIIGVIIAFSAYSFYQNAEERNNFHLTLSNFLNALKQDTCYHCLQNIRVTLSVFFFTAGVSLIFDVSIIIPLFSELLITLITIVKVTKAFSFTQIQILLIHLLIVLVLAANWFEQHPCKNSCQGSCSHSNSLIDNRIASLEQPILDRKSQVSSKQGSKIPPKGNSGKGRGGKDK